MSILIIKLIKITVACAITTVIIGLINKDFAVGFSIYIANLIELIIVLSGIAYFVKSLVEYYLV